MPQEGWYSDPNNKLQQRFWDGATWTDQARPLPPPQEDAAVPELTPVPSFSPPSASLDQLPPPYPAAPPYVVGLVAPTSQLAIWSMVSSLLGLFCGVGLIVGIVLGFVSLGQFKTPGNNQRGRGMAIAGIVIGFAGIVIIALVLAFGGIHFTTCGTVGHPACQ